MVCGEIEQSIKDFDYKVFSEIDDLQRSCGNPGTRKKRFLYKNVLCAFDIETTRISFTDETVMYIWQFCFLFDNENYIAVYGRTWSEFKNFIKSLNELMEDNERLLIFVHNLSYEFQFLRGIFEFSQDDVFAVKSRKVLRCNIDKCEFRCSYLQTNMNLRAFLKKMGVQNQKTELDYSGKRYWYTTLTPEEMRYNLNDVIGLCQAMYIQMRRDGDTLYTLPLTSTGYVRRDAKNAMSHWPKEYIPQILPEFIIYVELKEAFRGGNTHANRYYTGILVESGYCGLIHSADRSSSYPAVQCNNLYPVSRFYRLEKPDFESVTNLIRKRKRAILTRVKIHDVSLKDETWGCPYLSIAKSRNIKNSVNDNGRILSAEYLETTITDIDLAIILSEYKWSNIEFFDTYHARYGKLPKPLIECTISYYRMKTELKGVKDPEFEYQYMKSKNKLNSIYGMMAQDPVKQAILFKNEEFELDTVEESELLSDYYKRAFLSYAWGVWVTAWARYRLEEGIELVHKTPRADFLYTDTDSIKYTGYVDFSQYNNERIEECKTSGAYATDANGITHYMGVFETEEDMKAFKTYGAKKYCYVDIEGKTHLTVAGVGKVDGLAELMAAGGIREFNEGFVFLRGGGLESVYNDRKCGEAVYIIDENGEKQRVTSNVTLRNSSYTMGITAEYQKLLHGMEIEALDI